MTMRPVWMVLLISALAACASAPKKVAPPSYDALLSQAEAQVVSAGPDAAITGFEEAARADPTRKEPWVRISQLQFDRGNYAHAIMAAEEVLQRDPDDLVADGVMTVAGFRIANKSLQRLQGRGALASGTARKEAETLAATLRATMGDAILAPPPKPKAQRKSQRRGASRAAPARRADTDSDAEAAPPATPAAPARPASSGADADPFKNIRGN